MLYSCTHMVKQWASKGYSLKLHSHYARHRALTRGNARCRASPRVAAVFELSVINSC